MDITVDASVVAKWFFIEPFKDEADALIDRSFRFNAPDLLASEFLSVVQKHTYYKKITVETGFTFIKRFRKLSI